MEINKLIGPDWAQHIGSEFGKQYMKDLAKFIKEERSKHTVYPDNGADVFSVYRNTSFDSIKVVILGQDPYPDGSYHGMAFSNDGLKSKISPSLQNILKEVEDDVYDGFQLNQNPDLTRWQEQGVFLLNKVLTVRKNKPGSHRGVGWEEFTAQTIRVLNAKRSNLVFMLWGGEARRFSIYVNRTNHLVLGSGHPSPLSANRGYWFGNKHFTQANDYLRANNMKQIIW